MFHSVPTINQCMEVEGGKICENIYLGRIAIRKVSKTVSKFFRQMMLAVGRPTAEQGNCNWIPGRSLKETKPRQAVIYSVTLFLWWRQVP